MPQALRSILAIIVGYLTMVAIVLMSTLTFVRLFHIQSGHPTPGFMIANTIFSALAAFTGGWLAAYIAAYKPVQHGAALAIILLAFSMLMLIHPAPGQPILYQALIAIMMPLTAIAGAATERAKS